VHIIGFEFLRLRLVLNQLFSVGHYLMLWLERSDRSLSMVKLLSTIAFNMQQMYKVQATFTVTVTEAFILRPLLKEHYQLLKVQFRFDTICLITVEYSVYSLVILVLFCRLSSKLYSS